MPVINELERLAQSYSLATAILIIGNLALTSAVIALFRRNESLHELMRTLQSERVKSLEMYREVDLDRRHRT